MAPTSTDVRRGNVLSIEGDEAKHDMGTMLSWKPLMDVLASLSRQVGSQQREIEKLTKELDKERKLLQATKINLQSQIDEKASEKSVSALAIELNREKVETARRFDALSNDVASKMKRVDQRAEAQAAKMVEIRMALDNKAEAVLVQKLIIRVDACATSLELSNLKIDVLQKIDAMYEEHTKRHDKAEQTILTHGEQLEQHEQRMKSFAVHEEVAYVDRKLQESAETSTKTIAEVAAGAVSREVEMQRKLEARQAEAEEVTAKHWSHLLFVEEICRTKADNEMMLHKLDEQTSALNVVDEKHTSKVNELILDTKKHNDATDKYLQHLDQRLQTEEETMLTKSTLTEAQELRDKIGMCALRAETRELLDVLRQEVAARVRMMKERLDRTDHELMRQLEESYTTDRSERLTSVVQQLDAKAEKESLERMSESTQQMYAELQALHVRTQTLGQGMKVVLGWFEGMSDKVNGLQGAQRHIQHQIAVTKEETVTALNEATKATISRVKNLVNDKATAAQQQADKSFRPLSRPRSSAAPSGPVSVKPGQTSPTIGDHNSPRVNPSPPADIAALGDSVGELSGSHLAGAAGVALGSPRSVGSPRGFSSPRVTPRGPTSADWSGATPAQAQVLERQGSARQPQGLERQAVPPERQLQALERQGSASMVQQGPTLSAAMCTERKEIAATEQPGALPQPGTLPQPATAWMGKKGLVSIEPPGRSSSERSGMISEDRVASDWADSLDGLPASDGRFGLFGELDNRPSTAPFKTEAERRRYHLDQKRAEIVEARLSPGGPHELSPSPRARPPNRAFAPNPDVINKPLVQPLVGIPPPHPPTKGVHR